MYHKVMSAAFLFIFFLMWTQLFVHFIKLLKVLYFEDKIEQLKPNIGTLDM